MPELRQVEIDLVVEAIAAGQSLLVIGQPGEGKTHLAEQVQDRLCARGWDTALTRYRGQAKDLLIDLAEALDIPTTIEVGDSGREKPMTATQLKAELLSNLPRPNQLIILDDADRLPTSIRYWLEDCHKANVRMLLVAAPPPAKDIFLKLVRIEMQPLKKDDVRWVMTEEAVSQGIQLTPAQLAELQQRAGSNPYLAKRAVWEAALGLDNNEVGDHAEYIDGTPFLIALLASISIIRFIGLGLGDRSLYIIGGISMVLGIIVRTFYYAANKRSTKLGHK